MAKRKKKIKYFKSTAPVIRTDSMDLNPNVRYQDVRYKMQSDWQDYEAYGNQFKHDGIAHTVVAKLPEDATRNGWRIIIANDARKQAIYQTAMDKLKLDRVFTQQGIYQRSGGDGYITVGVKETTPTDTSTPLDPDNVEDVVFVHAFGQKHVREIRTNNDPTSGDYGKEQSLVVNPTESGSTVDRYGNIQPAPSQKNTVVIDRSRYLHISLDKLEDDLTGTSMLDRCAEPLKMMAIAQESVGKMLREYTFKVFKSDQLMAETGDKYRRDRDEVTRIMNTEATAFLHSTDSLEKVPTQTAGISDLLNFAWQALSTACQIPKSVLTGEQAGTLAGASQDVQNYYDSVRAWQIQVLKPEIEYIVKLLMYADNIGDGQEDPDSIDWHIEFNPLWTPDDSTVAKNGLTKMQTAVAGLGGGIFDVDEAKQYVNGQGSSQGDTLQNTAKTDSADDVESRYTKDEIEQYYKDLEKAHDGKA